MNEVNKNLCGCNACPGSQCRCGCQATAAVAQETCACGCGSRGSQCRCEGTCAQPAIAG